MASLQDVLAQTPGAGELSAAARGAQGVPAGGQPQAAGLQELLLQLTGGQVDPEMLMQLLALLTGAGGVPAGAPPAAADDQSAIAAAFQGR